MPISFYPDLYQNGPCFLYLRLPIAAAGIGAFAAYIPFLTIGMDRTKRMATFEEQLPDAIDTMKRALRAGHPLSAALKFVADEMDDPVSAEFELTFGDINYGNDVRRAMLGLLARVPSVTVMALVTSILVQKETGGNLAEILENISGVIRGRFRFQRERSRPTPRKVACQPGSWRWCRSFYL